MAGRPLRAKSLGWPTSRCLSSCPNGHRTAPGRPSGSISSMGRAPGSAQGCTRPAGRSSALLETRTGRQVGCSSSSRLGPMARLAMGQPVHALRDVHQHPAQHAAADQSALAAAMQRPSSDELRSFAGSPWQQAAGQQRGQASLSLQQAGPLSSRPNSTIGSLPGPAAHRLRPAGQLPCPALASLPDSNLSGSTIPDDELDSICWDSVADMQHSQQQQQQACSSEDTIGSARSGSGAGHSTAAEPLGLAHTAACWLEADLCVSCDHLRSLPNLRETVRPVSKHP